MAKEAVYIDLVEGSAPADPDTGNRRIYAKTDGVYERDDAGTEAGPLGSGTAGSGDVTVIPKTADETVNGSSVLQNDDELVHAIGANEVWGFEVNLFYSSGTTPDLKYGWAIPAGASIYWSRRGQAADGTDASQSFTEQGAGTNTSFIGGGAGSGLMRSALMYGFVSNGATPGNLQLQWAQNTSNGSDTVVYKGSSMRVWRIA